MTTLVPLLSALRMARGLSQHEMARKLQISRSCYCELECGRKNPRRTTLKKLARALQMSMADVWELLEAEQLPR